MIIIIIHRASYFVSIFYAPRRWHQEELKTSCDLCFLRKRHRIVMIFKGLSSLHKLIWRNTNVFSTRWENGIVNGNRTSLYAYLDLCFRVQCANSNKTFALWKCRWFCMLLSHRLPYFNGADNRKWVDKKDLKRILTHSSSEAFLMEFLIIYYCQFLYVNAECSIVILKSAIL